MAGSWQPGTAVRCRPHRCARLGTFCHKSFAERLPFTTSDVGLTTPVPREFQGLNSRGKVLWEWAGGLALGDGCSARGAAAPGLWGRSGGLSCLRDVAPGTALIRAL